MTADRRLRIGAWAALFVAILAPIELIAAGLTADPRRGLNLTAASVVEIVRFVALLVAVMGLAPLFASLAPRWASLVGIVGIVAAILLIATDAVDVAGVDLGPAVAMLSLAGSALIGAWFIGSGAIFMRQGGDLARVGWTAQLGGLGNVLTALALALGASLPNGGSPSWIGWFRILGLFVIVYLIRVWNYVVRGKLPSAGII